MDEAAGLIRNGEKEKARPLLEENILAGCTDSMVLLGTVLSDGTEDERNRSIALFKEAAELGNNSGMRNLAYCYAIGLNVVKDKRKGAELYTKAAEMGNARAACNIGVMLDYGNGVEKNYDEAFLWYLRSAEGGCTRGMTNLGEYYLWGRGTEKNVRKAEEWFIRSASPRAFYRLSEIYMDCPGFIDPKKGRECRCGLLPCDVQVRDYARVRGQGEGDRLLQQGGHEGQSGCRRTPGSSRPARSGTLLQEEKEEGLTQFEFLSPHCASR